MDGGTRYLVADDDAQPEPETLVRVVDTATGLVGPRVMLGSVTAQEEPDVWQPGTGPEERAALALAAG